MRMVLMIGLAHHANASAKSEIDKHTATNLIEAATVSENEQASELQREPRCEAAEAEVAPGTSSSRKRAASKVWKTYVNRKYDFRVAHPRGFVIQPQDSSKIAQFTPAPLASIFFMNPTMATGDLAGQEPPDLEVRVYKADEADSLKSWLTSVGFASADGGAVNQPYQHASVSGLEVCQSTLIAPGCSIYVLRSGRVYQLTPISIKGERMIETFAFLP
jgi:hypothetical protein